MFRSKFDVMRIWQKMLVFLFVVLSGLKTGTEDILFLSIQNYGVDFFTLENWFHIPLTSRIRKIAKSEMQFYEMLSDKTLRGNRVHLQMKCFDVLFVDFSRIRNQCS